MFACFRRPRSPSFRRENRSILSLIPARVMSIKYATRSRSRKKSSIAAGWALQRTAKARAGGNQSLNSRRLSHFRLSLMASARSVLEYEEAG